MKYLTLLLSIMILLVGCASPISDNGEVTKAEVSSKPKNVPMGVSGDLVRGFIRDSEFFGLQQLEPDPKFFVHLAAPGFAVQLEGKNSDEMTGAMIDISYESENFGMGRGTIAHLLMVILGKERSIEADRWVTNQFIDAERKVRNGEKPHESQFEIDNLVIVFFPPTSVDSLSATILMYATDKIIPKTDTKDNSNLPEQSLVNNRKGIGQSEENVIESSEDVNATNDFGVTKLAKAAGEGDIDLVKELLSQGADPNLSKGMGEPPLLWAVRTNQDQIVKILLEAGANPNFKSKEGVTPLSIAKENGANVILQYLEEYGAKE